MRLNKTNLTLLHYSNIGLTSLWVYGWVIKLIEKKTVLRDYCLKRSFINLKLNSKSLQQFSNFFWTVDNPTYLSASFETCPR